MAAPTDEMLRKFHHLKQRESNSTLDPPRENNAIDTPKQKSLSQDPENVEEDLGGDEDQDATVQLFDEGTVCTSVKEAEAFGIYTEISEDIQTRKSGPQQLSEEDLLHSLMGQAPDTDTTGIKKDAKISGNINRLSVAALAKRYSPTSESSTLIPGISQLALKQRFLKPPPNKMPLQVNAISGGSPTFNGPTQVTAIGVLQLVFLEEPLQLPIHRLPYEKNPHFVGRNDTIKYIEESVNRQSISIVTSGSSEHIRHTLVGLGGIGKTHLVNEYIYRSIDNKSYSIIGWISAESTATITRDFITLADLLNIPTNIADRARINKTISVLQQIQPPFRWLLVFDDASDYKSIQEYIPKINSNHHIIIISKRNDCWKNEVLMINVFTLSESIEFLEQVIKGRGNNFTEEEKVQAKNLAILLGRLPLALAHAGAYIKHPLNKITMAQYIQNYESNKKKFLSTILPTEDHAPVLYTYDLTKNAVEKESKLAICLLEISAYLSGNIPFDLLEELSRIFLQETSENDDFFNALEVLNHYSMIIPNMDHRIVSIHSILQDVIRIQMEEKSQQRLKYILQSLIVTTKLLQNNDRRNIKNLRSFALQLEVLVMHAETIEVTSNELVQAQYQLGYGFYLSGDYEKAINYMKKAIKAIQIPPQEWVHKLANAYREQGRNQDKSNESDNSLQIAFSLYNELKEKHYIREILFDYSEALCVQQHILNTRRNTQNFETPEYSTADMKTKAFTSKLIEIAEEVEKENSENNTLNKYRLLSSLYFDISEAFNFRQEELTKCIRNNTLLLDGCNDLLNYPPKLTKENLTEVNLIKSEALNMLGCIYLYNSSMQNKKDIVDIIKLFVEVISIRATVYGQDIPCPPQYINNLCNAYLEGIKRNPDDKEFLLLKIDKLYKFHHTVAYNIYGETAKRTIYFNKEHPEGYYANTVQPFLNNLELNSKQYKPT